MKPESGVLTIILWQTITIVVTALVTGAIADNWQASIIVLFGGLPAVIGSMILSRRVRKATSANAHVGMAYLYLALIERLGMTIVFLALGHIVFQFALLFMIVGLIAGQVGFVLGSINSKT